MNKGFFYLLVKHANNSKEQYFNFIMKVLLQVYRYYLYSFCRCIFFINVWILGAVLLKAKCMSGLVSNRFRFLFLINKSSENPCSPRTPARIDMSMKSKLENVLQFHEFLEKKLSFDYKNVQE